MSLSRQVAHIPSKPVMLYDRDCGFCVLWIRRWQQATGEAVDYLALQDSDVVRDYPELSRERLEQAVHFIDTDGRVSEGAEAVFRSLATRSSKRWMLRWYQDVPLFARGSEWGYRFVAGHRTLFSALTRILWGRSVERADTSLARWVFLRGLAVVYLIAFVSLWVQLPGLVGKDGILPASDFMSQVQTAANNSGVGIDRYRLLPTLCWFGASDTFLEFQCAAGAVLALVLLFGVAQPVCLALLWLLYLSLATVCGDFLGFQWDNLLLEAGWLAIFLAPFQVLPRASREAPPSRIILWLLRLLLFKLMFLSGAVKLASGDVTWRDLTALTHHYETQPLPTWIGWYAHQLPVWFQRGSCAILFVVELAVPFLIFAPRRLRMAGGAAIALLQVLILLTGNYTFFNWLTLVLCLLLLDDVALSRILPRKLSLLFMRSTSPGRGVPAGGQRRQRWVIVPVAVMIVSITFIQLGAPFGPLPAWTSPVVSVYRWLSPFRCVNSYGLFAVMTTQRLEIVVEGSNDGRDWREYEFPDKPGDVDRRPRFVAPYQPRLDWQMWFAALGDVRQNPWFVNFCIRLLQGSPEVLALMEHNPFPEHPPRYIRARLYDYRFTSIEERRRTGAWWKRELKGDYLPPISLQMLQPVPHPPPEAVKESAALTSAETGPALVRTIHQTADPTLHVLPERQFDLRERR